ncbi:MAG: RNA methyltransferase [Phascolarctobacterium sp.]|uniref:TrmH family RNA methyltransferase n=1 Tax=Phascolarctobacterium sp. TaxID=2049039 RepID=UPI0025EAD1F1|nr:RNA methyltransferase [Phascolarctobacterium sp.]MCC8159261.1 RNA methyltransferase [Phascolarctobacterium sp.]
MANIIEITDIYVPELEVFAQLTEKQLRHKLEPEKGIFIAESGKVIELALAAGCEPVSLLLERKQLTGQGKNILARYDDVTVYTGDREVLAGLTGYRLTRGILCAMRRPQLPPVQQICARASRVAVLDNITDAANVGGIFRSAAALGVDAVLVMRSCCDPLCRKAVRVSMGTVFQIPWTYIENGIAPLQELGFKTAALALREQAVSIDDPKLMAEARLALIFGTEGYGLAQATIDACDYVVQIPMAHDVDSLNVAAASAVTFWQLRHR